MIKKLKKYYVKTYGCQMNVADSEQISQVLEAKGYKLAKSIKEADLVVINTCSVRQSAEDRVLGLVNNLNKLKVKSEKLRVILTGCMLRYPPARLKKMLPGVDRFIKLKDLIHNSRLDSARQASFIIHNSKAPAFVKIMEGCDNFCTYCVVPSARGREKSRPIEEIICEVKELVKRGVREITLLGQNVNSYHKNLKFPPSVQAVALGLSSRVDRLILRWASKTQRLQKKYKNNFAILLALLHSIKGLKKISFLTSNPQDLTEDIIKAMKLPKIDRYLHLPVQSGDDEILKKMNRKYTSSQYLRLITKLKKEIPNLCLGTDIIVGFPGETDKQFKNTVKLVKKVKFKVAYISKYSPRWGTPAYNFKDNISWKEKKRRWEILDKLINKRFSRREE